MERRIPIQDEDIKQLVDKKNEILKEGQENAKKAQELQERNKELEEQLNPIKEELLDKSSEKEKDLDLKEFEVINTTETDEEGNYNFVIEDKYEIFKQSFHNTHTYEQGSNQTNTPDSGMDGDREDDTGGTAEDTGYNEHQHDETEHDQRGDSEESGS